MTATVIQGDCRTVLRTLDAGSVQCCVTSPPYWGLRDYGTKDQLGLEPTPDAYVREMVRVFREVWRVLREDGTLWLNLGDTFNSNPSWGRGHSTLEGRPQNEIPRLNHTKVANSGLKVKDLCGIPWRVALALQADGWYLRSDIIWAKPNPMPESVTDRPTKAHEYLFLLSKSEKYFYDYEAIQEHGITNDMRKPFAPGQVDARGNGHDRGGGTLRKTDKQRGHGRRHDGFNDRWDKMEREEQCSGMRNKRSVWTIATSPYSEAHFATFPPDLIKPCILAGSKAGDTVLDPFGGSGTTGMVALEYGRKAVLIELNPAYVALCYERCAVTPGLAL